MVMPMAVPAARPAAIPAKNRPQPHPVPFMLCSLLLRHVLLFICSAGRPGAGYSRFLFILSPSAEKCVAKSCWFRYNLT